MHMYLKNPVKCALHLFFQFNQYFYSVWIFSEIDRPLDVNENMSTIKVLYVVS